MGNRVTIQNIADALGLSRNTVSKAINNTGVLADATREKILLKAKEMGYKQFSYLSLSDLQIREEASGLPGNPSPAPPPQPESRPEGGSIALLTTRFLGGSHFAATMLDKVQRELIHFGYSLTVHRITEENLSGNTLPATFSAADTKGIICVEVFDCSYSHMLCELSIPILFVDAPVNINSALLKADRLLMDSRSNIWQLISVLARNGSRKFGFIGDYMHCMSFFERHSAFLEACSMLGLDCDERYCVTESATDIINFPDHYSYQDYLFQRFSTLEKLPDAFICANDFVALDTIFTLRKIGIRVPEDVLVAGFDDSPESQLISPALTTIHIHTQVMGLSAVWLLISRIREPQMHYRTVYSDTTLIWRDSTGQPEK